MQLNMDPNQYGKIANNLVRLFAAQPSGGELENAGIARDMARAKLQNVQGKNDALGRKNEAARALSALFGGMPQQRQALTAIDDPALDDPAAFPENLPETTPAFDARTNAQKFFQDLPAQLASAGALTGDNGAGKGIAELFRFVTANSGGSDNDIIRAMAGAGKAIGVNQAVSLDGQTAVRDANAAHDKDEALAKIAATPLTLSQQQGQAFSQLPSETQSIAVGPGFSKVRGAVASELEGPARDAALFGVDKVADANSPSGITITPRTDAAGQPGVAPQAAKASDVLTSSTKTNLQVGKIEAQNFKGMIDIARKIGTDERNFGASGAIRGTVQDAIQQGDALAQTLGGTAQDVQQDILNVGSDVNLDNFNSDISQLGMLENLMAYQLAKFNDPAGRVSDKDFKAAKESLGLSGLLANKNKFMARLNLLENMIASRGQRATDALGGGAPAPDSAPADSTVEQWGRGADGSLQRIQ